VVPDGVDTEGVSSGTGLGAVRTGVSDPTDVSLHVFLHSELEFV
jgi:hypothetical protein